MQLRRVISKIPSILPLSLFWTIQTLLSSDMDRFSFCRLFTVNRKCLLNDANSTKCGLSFTNRIINDDWLMKWMFFFLVFVKLLCHCGLTNRIIDNCIGKWCHKLIFSRPCKIIESLWTPSRIINNCISKWCQKLTETISGDITAQFSFHLSLEDIDYYTEGLLRDLWRA